MLSKHLSLIITLVVALLIGLFFWKFMFFR